MNKKKRIWIILITVVFLVVIIGTIVNLAFRLKDSRAVQENKINQESQEKQDEKTTAQERVTAGTEQYKGFLMDNVLHSDEEGDIHYNVFIPDSYDGSKPYALFLTLPGYQGLYFQGVGSNIKTEEFGFTAREYNSEMIIVAPQLNDWGETSARQTIVLTQYFLSAYNIDKSKVYAEGYSGGGETMSLVMGMKPELSLSAV